MDTHTEEEEKVDDTMVLGADNPHAYLFGGDPIEPSEPETYSAPPVVERELPPPPQQSLKPSSPKQIVAPPVLSAPKATSEIKRTVKAGEFDERFKATVEYQSIMTTLVRLKDQREQAIQDLKRLETERQKAHDNPQVFVSTLLSKREVLPRRQVPPSVPTVDFTIYEKLAQKPGGTVKVEVTRPTVKRVANVAKSVANNTPWTLEEQHRLEQLLIEHPDEPIAAYRWEKIARALGRTPKQVVSRIHRYFERLARAGLPVPGRLPTSARQAPSGAAENSRQASSSSSSHAPPRAYNILEAPAIKMNSALPVIDDANLLTDGEKRIFAGLEHTDDYKELIRLKRLKQLQERSGEHVVQMREPSIASGTKSAGEVHPGTKCSSCHSSPIYGTLYSCAQCVNPRTTLCGNCYAQHSFTSTHHTLDHTFDVEQSVQFIDSDYALTDEMAYLDPNYGAD